MKMCPWCGKEYPDEVSTCAIDQTPLESRDAVPAPATGEPEEADVSGEESDGFCTLGEYDAFEAERLLKRFSEAGIPFRVERVERRERSGATSYRTEGFIEIYVRPEDHARADQIVTEDWKV